MNVFFHKYFLTIYKNIVYIYINMNKLLKTKMHSWLNKRFLLTFFLFVGGLAAFNSSMKKNSKPTRKHIRIRNGIYVILIGTMVFMVLFPETFLKHTRSLL